MSVLLSRDLGQSLRKKPFSLYGMVAQNAVVLLLLKSVIN